MTSRSCTKSYNRKVSNVIPGSIQFDKLFRENSNRPSAAKSAGTVGKWGITSFTSIRSTNINGKRDITQSTFATKKMKLEYVNQNARVSSGKDPFSFDSEADNKTETANTVPAVPVIKPKKFFKSRNAPTVPEETPQNTTIHKHVPDSHFGRVRSQKQCVPKQSPPHSPPSKVLQTLPSKTKVDANLDDPTKDDNVLLKEDSKPPIVLRICKGTAHFVCGGMEQDDNQGELETETYRISTPLANLNKINIERKNSSNSETKLDSKILRPHPQPIVSTVSIPIESSDMRRTTRSRAKNMQLDLPPIMPSINSAITPSATISPPSNSHSSSGLSLTLRKSVTDSNNTLISHYDIVKTDASYSTTKSTIEPLIARDQPLPTTTQELIDILSSDNDSLSVRPSIDNQDRPPLENADEITDIIEAKVERSTIDVSSPSIDQIKAEKNVESDPETEEIQSQREETIIDKNEAVPSDQPPQTPIDESEPAIATAAAKTLVDQDWFSSSEDSEGPCGNTEIEAETETSTLSNNTNSVLTLESSLPPTTAVAVKPPTKKGSIFKSRSTGTTNGNKRRALYKHKWCDNDKEPTTTETPNIGNNNQATDPNSLSTPGVVAFTEEFDASQLTRVVTYPETDDIDFDKETEAVTSVRCGKKVKGFYTVVKNVKKAHQIQESGEFQEFNDDVEYILDTLRENNPNATRCLSAIRLASKCMAPAFRMHVRAHGTVAKFFKALHDATKDQSLGLCTATVMFVLSQDRLAMDLDRDCLELMLSLLESDASHKDALDDCGLSRAELLKNKEKVRQLCADIQAQGHANHLNLDNITVGQLAMETLLSLTSKRAGEWFKEELRELGGLEHIVKTIRDCHCHIIAQDITRSGWSDSVLDKLRKVDRCLRVLENVTHMNEENQVYLLKYGDGLLVNTLASLYHLCGEEIQVYPTHDPSDKTSTGAVIRECLFAILKVLINLTHRFNRQSFGSRSVGTQSNVLDNSLNLLLRIPESLPEEKRFDIMMLALILLINLVDCEENRQLLIKLKAPPAIDDMFSTGESGLEALIDLFYQQEELARAEEQKTDAILDGKKDSEQTETVSTTTKSQEEFIEETVTKLLQKAGRHMEHTLIGAYVVLLLGYLIMDDKDYESLVRSRLPDNNFTTMVSVLQKFFNFMNLTASNELSSCGLAATEKVIKFLKMSDARIEEEKNELPLPALEDSNTMLDLSSS